MMRNSPFLWIIAAVLAVMLTPVAFGADVCETHDYQWAEMEATCLESGSAGYVCTVCGRTKDYTVVPKLGHDYGEWFTAVEPSCSGEGQEQSVCARCDSALTRQIAKLPHRETVRVFAPTCGRDGYTLHTCTVCGHEERTDTVEKLGHNYVVTVLAPTCTADGYTRHKCSNCGDAYRTDHMEKTGHLYDGGVETKEPTLTTMGRITYTCQYCGDTYQKTTPMWVDPFEDLDKKGYYYSPVLWAYNSGVTKGTDPSHFSPDGICSRAQVVTFLWRTAGAPEMEGRECPFSDVEKGSYYEQAVLWAVGEGITNGVGGNRFAPEEPCTRAQVVTFLHRAKGMPAAGSSVTFTDVESGSFYYDAVSWSYENGVTAGTGGSRFSPDAVCTRAQIVTFLYRARKL